MMPLQIFIVIKQKSHLLGSPYLVSDFTSNGTYTVVFQLQRVVNLLVVGGG